MTLSLDSLIRRFSCLQVSHPAVSTNQTDALYLHLPKELLLHIARVDPHQQFFFSWRALCRTTRDLLPLDDVVYSSAFQSVGAVKVAKIVLRLLQRKEKGRALLFLHRFINEREMAMQESFIRKLFTRKLTKKLFCAELTRLTNIRYLLITSDILSLKGFSLAQFPKIQSLTISLSDKRYYPIQLLSLVKPHTLQRLEIPSDVHQSIGGHLLRSQTNLEWLSLRSKGMSHLTVGMLTLELIHLRHVHISLT